MQHRYDNAFVLQTDELTLKAWFDEWRCYQMKIYIIKYFFSEFIVLKIGSLTILKFYKVPFNWKAWDCWPRFDLIDLVSRFFPCGVWLFVFLDIALLFWFLSKSYVFLASNLKLFCWTGLYKILRLFPTYDWACIYLFFIVVVFLFTYRGLIVEILMADGVSMLLL